MDIKATLPRCSGSLESRVSRAESVYEMGDDYSDHDQVEDDHLQRYWQDPQHQGHPLVTGSTWRGGSQSYTYKYMS